MSRRYTKTKVDAGMNVLVLRHLADEVEKNNPGLKEFAEGMKKCIKAPSISEVEHVKRANKI